MHNHRQHPAMKTGHKTRKMLVGGDHKDDSNLSNVGNPTETLGKEG